MAKLQPIVNVNNFFCVILLQTYLLQFMQPSGLGLSLADSGYICISTIISVVVHEFGHAVAATRSVVFALLPPLIEI